MCKTGLNQSETSLNKLKRQGKTSLPGNQHQTVTNYSIIRIYNKDWSCDRAIFILHDWWVGYITEKLYFSSINGTIQCMISMCLERFIASTPFYPNPRNQSAWLHMLEINPAQQSWCSQGLVIWDWVEGRFAVECSILGAGTHISAR